MIGLEEAKQRLKDIEHHFWGDSIEEISWVTGQYDTLKQYIRLIEYLEEHGESAHYSRDLAESTVRQETKQLKWKAQGAADAMSFLEGTSDGEYHS